MLQVEIAPGQDVPQPRQRRGDDEAHLAEPFGQRGAEPDGWVAGVKNRSDVAPSSQRVSNPPVGQRHVGAPRRDVELQRLAVAPDLSRRLSPSESATPREQLLEGEDLRAVDRR